MHWVAKHMAPFAGVSLNCRGIVESELPLASLTSALRGGFSGSAVMPEDLDNKLNEMARHYLEAASGPRPEPPAEVFAKLADALGNVAREQFMLICLDDLQWVDRATLSFLEYFWLYCRNMPQCRFLLVIGARPLQLDTPHGQWLQRIRGDEQTRVRTLHPLHRPDTERLINQLDARPKSLRFLQLIWEISLGNPLFAVEVFRYFLQGDRVYDRSGYLEIRAQPDVIKPTEGVAAIFRQDLTALKSTTRSTLIRAAALSDEFDLPKLTDLLSQPFEQVVAAFEEAEQAGLVEWRDNRVRLRHPILRQVLFDFPSRTEWARVNLELAQNLSGGQRVLSDVERVRVAGLYLHGRALIDPGLFFTLMREAATAASSISAWDLSARYALAAVDAAADAQADELTVVELRLNAARCQHKIGLIDEAVVQLDSILCHPESKRFARPYAQALNEKVRIDGNFGRMRDTTQVVELEALVEDSSEAALASRMCETLSHCYQYVLFEPERARAFASRAVELVSGASGIEAATALITKGLSDLRFAGMGEADAAFARAAELAARCGDKSVGARALQRASVSRFLLGDAASAAQMSRQSKQLDPQIYHTGETTIPLGVEVCLQALAGEHDLVEEIYQEAERLASSSGYRWATNYFLGGYVYSIAQRGGVEAVCETLEAVLAGDSSSVDRRILTNYLKLLRDEPDYELAAFDGSPCHTARMTRYGMDVDWLLRRGSLAVASQQADAMRCRDALRSIQDRGVQVTLGIPYLVSLQLARLEYALGDVTSARLHLHTAQELVASRWPGFKPQLAAFEATLAA